MAIPLHDTLTAQAHTRNKDLEMKAYHNTAVLKFDDSTTGNAASGATVTVRINSTQGLASMFNLADVAIANPMNTDSNGNYAFKVDDNIYDIIISEGTANEVKLEKVEISVSAINSVSVTYNFATVALYKVSTILFPVGKRVYLADRDSYFNVIAGTLADNTLNIVASTSVDQSIDIIQEDGFNSMRQLGYDVALENAHTVVNVVSALGIQIKAADNSNFLFSDTIVIPPKGLTLTTETGEFSGCKFVASASFDSTKQLIDTLNYDYLKANNVKVTTPDGGGIGSPQTISILGIEFVGKYDATTLAAPVINQGIGARIYGGYLRLNIKVSDIFNVGVLTYYPEGTTGVAGNNNNVIDAISKITVVTSNTGREGFVFDGPPDAILGDVICRDASSSNFGLESVTPVDSVEYPGNTEKLSPAIDIRKACHHIGFMNGFGTRNGWSTNLENNRFDSSGHVQVDSSDGGLRAGPDSRPQLASLELHGMTYGFITHSGVLRPYILNKSVAGFKCENIKIALGGDNQNRNIVDVQGVGAGMSITVYPVFPDAPSNLGELLNIAGRQHNININTSSTMAFTKGVDFGNLYQSKVTGQLHLTGDKMVDFTGQDATRDKSNTIDIVGTSVTGSPANIVSGLGQLTRQDLTETNISVYSTTNSKTYSTKASTKSADVVISNGSKSTPQTHNYVGTPTIDQITIGFHPVAITTIMPIITNVKISSITAFSVNVTYDVSGGSGSLFVSSRIN